MVVIGIDAHKRTHTAVICDQHGRELARRSVGTSSGDHFKLLGWARTHGRKRLWAVEDCRHLSRRLERDLLSAGERIVRVPPKLMANTRDGGRSYGKSDAIDALAVARAALREPDLPQAGLDGPERELRLLVDHREDLVGERTRAINRLRWHLHELDPALERNAGRLSRRSLQKLASSLEGWEGHRRSARARACRALHRARHPDCRARARDRRARRNVRAGAAFDLRLRNTHRRQDPRRDGRHRTLPLPRRIRPTQRHRPAARLVRAAPPPPPQPHRQPAAQRGAAPDRAHPIAMAPAAKDLLARRRANGDAGLEALRVLKRRLSDVVYRAQLKDAQQALTRAA